MKKRYLLIPLGGLIALAGAATVAYPKYRAAQERQHARSQIAEILLKDAARMETLLKLEEESKGVTFGELYETCDKNLSERNGFVVDLRSLNPPVSLQPAVQAAIRLLNTENTYTRAKRAYWKAVSDYNTAEDALKRNKTAHKASMQATDVAIKRRDLAGANRNLATAEHYLNQMPGDVTRLEATSKSAQDAIDSLMRSLSELKQTETDTVKAITENGITARTVFNQYYDQSVQKTTTMQEKLKATRL